MHENLFSLIRGKCQREGWYGPVDFKRGRVAWARPFSFEDGFAFPPGTEEQIRETELLLGFSLPPLLCMLYTQLANGGFGPGAGIRGAVGGYGAAGTFESGNNETIVKYHLRPEHDLVDVSHFLGERQESHRRRSLDLPSHVWPRQLLPLCDLGCVQEVCLDQQGHVFMLGSSKRNFVYVLSDQGISFEQWLRRWLDS
jgi:hypothetical protein